MPTKPLALDLLLLLRFQMAPLVGEPHTQCSTTRKVTTNKFINCHNTFNYYSSGRKAGGRAGQKAQIGTPNRAQIGPRLSCPSVLSVCLVHLSFPILRIKQKPKKTKTNKQPKTKKYRYKYQTVSNWNFVKDWFELLAG